MAYDTYRPDWVPEEGGSQFSCRVMTGVEGERDGAGTTGTAKAPARKKLTLEDYEKGILEGNRMILSRAITLIESNAPKHFGPAQELVQSLLPHTGGAIRVGITGVPGVGKSTFIEALGCTLCEAGHKVAVLAVDPSSSVTGGSILGDKTRMEQLTREPRAFIRPSPSSGTLGGVTRKSRETLLLCEAAGYDVILVETVGVGQSETTVRSMVDFFMVLVLTGAGDDLQGIKKGIIELADMIVVNKADGDNRRRALVTRSEYEQILHYLRPSTEGWSTGAYTCSSITKEGIDAIWEVVARFKEQMEQSGYFHTRRSKQAMEWTDTMVDEFLHHRIAQDQAISARRSEIIKQVESGETPPTLAAKMIIDVMEKQLFCR